MTFEKYLEENYPKPKNGYNHNTYKAFKKLWDFQQTKVDIAIQALEGIEKELDSEKGTPIKIGILTLKALVDIRNS